MDEPRCEDVNVLKTIFVTALIIVMTMLIAYVTPLGTDKGCGVYNGTSLPSMAAFLTSWKIHALVALFLVVYLVYLLLTHLDRWG